MIAVSVAATERKFFDQLREKTGEVAEFSYLGGYISTTEGKRNSEVTWGKGTSVHLE